MTKRETNHKYKLLVTLVKEQGQKLNTTTDCHRTQIEDIKNLLSGLAQQLEFVMQRILFAAGESSQGRDKQAAHQNESIGKPSYFYEGRPAVFKVYKPKHLFPVFRGDDVHRWLYKCNQYFEIEDIEDSEKLKLASYYLDDIALYWHQNFMRNLNNQRVSWDEYVKALC